MINNDTDYWTQAYKEENRVVSKTASDRAREIIVQMIFTNGTASETHCRYTNL